MRLNLKFSVYSEKDKMLKNKTKQNINPSK